MKSNLVLDHMGGKYENVLNHTVILNNCIHRIASGGYYGLRMSTLPPQCVEIFSRYPSRAQGIIGRLLKFSGYIHNHKILPGNIFGLILKNKMAATGISFQS